MDSHPPSRVIELVNKLVRASRDRTHATGVEPTPEELARILVMPVDQVRKLLDIARAPYRLDG